MGLLKKVKKRQIMLYQGEATMNVHLIRSGLVKAYVSSANGSEAIIGIFGPGDYFPTAVDVMEVPVGLFYYETLIDGEVEVFGVKEFKDFIAKEPREVVAKRYVSSLLHINALVQDTAYTKLAYILRYLALKFGTPINKIYTRIEIKLTQSDLAQLCNMSRETTNIELTKLKKESIVVEKNKLYSVNLSGLNKIVGHDMVDQVKI